MERRYALKSIIFGVVSPSIFIPRSDLIYKDVLKEIFGKVLEEGTYENMEFVVKIEGEDYLHTAHLEDRNSNQKFEHYEDWGHLKGMWYLSTNGETKVDYAKILFGRTLSGSTEISGIFDSDYFNEMEKEDVLEKLYRMDVFGKNYFEEGKFRAESIDRVQGMSEKPGKTVLNLYKAFVEHFKNNQDKNIINPKIKRIDNERNAEVTKRLVRLAEAKLRPSGRLQSV